MDSKHWVCIPIYLTTEPQNRASINTGQHTPHLINLGQWRPKGHMNTQNALLAECLIGQWFPTLSDHAHSLPARYVHHTTYLSVHSYHYTMLGHNLDLNIMTPINSSPFKSCLLLQHVSHKHQTTSHFRAYSALCKTPTGHCGTKCAFSAADNRSRCTYTGLNTHTHTINYSPIHHTHFNLIYLHK